MPQIICQARIPHQSALPEDMTVNTFVFAGAAGALEMAEAVAPDVSDFYRLDAPGQSQCVMDYMAGTMNFAGARLRAFDLSDPEPRVPIYDESMSLGAHSPLNTQNLPAEVALCASYRGPLESGTNPRRRRGRLYIGPLNVGGSTGTGVTPARPSGTMIAVWAGASKRLAGTNNDFRQWVVYSRRGGDFTEITAGWVDNSFDTQRRRGERASSRFNWEDEV